MNIEELVMFFLRKNYNYVYYNAMLRKKEYMRKKNATLITGSSYALSGIKEKCWQNAISLSMSSQDLYYDFKAAKDVIESVDGSVFSRCFIVKGYYSAVHDLSSSKKERERIISSVYWPIYKDAHNWEEPFEENLWEGIYNISDELKNKILEMAILKIQLRDSFYSDLRARGGTVFNLGDRKWNELSYEERCYLGNIRAEQHNKLFNYKESMNENIEIINDYVHLLKLNEILPIFVIAPFAREYTDNISKDMKESVMDMLEKVEDEVHFVDFNEGDMFTSIDFVDTDHLDECGAVKMSNCLVEMFGG